MSTVAPYIKPCIYFGYACMPVCMCACVNDVFVYARVYVCAHMCVYVCAHMCVYVCAHMCVYVWMDHN